MLPCCLFMTLLFGGVFMLRKRVETMLSRLLRRRGVDSDTGWRRPTVTVSQSAPAAVNAMYKQSQ